MKLLLTFPRLFICIFAIGLGVLLTACGNQPIPPVGGAASAVLGVDVNPSNPTSSEPVGVAVDSFLLIVTDSVSTQQVIGVWIFNRYDTTPRLRIEAVEEDFSDAQPIMQGVKLASASIYQADAAHTLSGFAITDVATMGAFIEKLGALSPQQTFQNSAEVQTYLNSAQDKEQSLLRQREVMQAIAARLVAKGYNLNLADLAATVPYKSVADVEIMRNFLDLSPLNINDIEIR
ncbi:MAG TPA: hypothetical protein PK299_04050 [Anaerolineales bacterium]|nr:hypothetical protein [Anaerolineales bacterium]